MFPGSRPVVADALVLVAQATTGGQGDGGVGSESDAIRPALGIGQISLDKLWRQLVTTTDRLSESLGFQLLVILFFLLLGIALSRYVVRLLGRPVARRFERQSVAQTVLRTIRMLTVLFVTVFGMGVVGVTLGNVVLSVTVFSAVVGIVLAPIVGSIISGLFILADQPYEIGDMIELDDGTRGFVEDITIRYTKVFTLDNTFIVFPNSHIRERMVTNLSAEDERTRLRLSVLITYESDIDSARELFERAARGCEGVLEGGPDIRIGSARYPAKPTCYIDEYADNGVLLTLRYWVMRPYKMLTARSRVQTELWRLLAESEADVEFAYPHQHLVFDEDSGEARVALREGMDGEVADVEPVRGDGPADRRRESDRSSPPDGDGPFRE